MNLKRFFTWYVPEEMVMASAAGLVLTSALCSTQHLCEEQIIEEPFREAIIFRGVSKLSTELVK